MSFEASHASRKRRAEPLIRQSQEPRLDGLQPLLAGAHARGMADALELAGIAAVLIDSHGMVLHAGDHARALFGAALRVEHDHLIGADGESTTAIQHLVEMALGQGREPASIALSRSNGTPLVLHARRVPGAAGNLCQMLKVLIMIEESPAHRVGN